MWQCQCQAACLEFKQQQGQCPNPNASIWHVLNCLYAEDTGGLQYEPKIQKAINQKAITEKGKISKTSAQLQKTKGKQQQAGDHVCKLMEASVVYYYYLNKKLKMASWSSLSLNECFAGLRRSSTAGAADARKLQIFPPSAVCRLSISHYALLGIRRLKGLFLRVYRVGSGNTTMWWWKAKLSHSTSHPV